MVEQQVTEESKIKLQLGDIIEFSAPSDDTINDKKYFIKFIDKTRIVLVGENQDIKELAIEDGSFRNESIIGINILSRASDPGYAKQNNLIPGNWINIFLMMERYRLL